MLDEIGELPPSLQVKLLRVLQERKVRPVGGTVELEVDVRVLAATNRDVEKDVEAGRFRTDLYYRLNVIRIELPPLRQRRSDVARLAQRMVKRFSNEFDKSVRGLTRDALRTLEHYDFPGNIRELENMMERAVALASGETIDVDDLPEAVTGKSGSPAAPTLVTDLPPDGCQLDRALEDIERRLLTQALERTDGVRKAAAELLGISFRSMRYRLAKLGMEVPRGAGEEDDEP
jgi:two-component system response regulator PilR (NtrC family)